MSGQTHTWRLVGASSAALLLLTLLGLLAAPRYDRDGMRSFATSLLNPSRHLGADIAVFVDDVPDRTMVGVAPLLPSSCAGERAHVLLTVAGQPFLMVVDTGSSNTFVPTQACDSCAGVSPKLYHAPTGPYFNISYGTGAVVLAQDSTQVSLAGLELPTGSVGAIIRQDTSFGFNFFPPPEDADCYNSFAGLMGLAYMSQDAGPAPGGGTTNGTTTAILDQLVARGMPNAFAIELCGEYPLPCDAHRRDNTTWVPTSDCGRQQVGSLMLGGYVSARISGPMLFTPITDQVHYDVQLIGVRVCGARACEQVEFPDSISGRTENDCVCSTSDCSPGTISYCSFTVIDSGTDAVYLNSASNARALLTTMQRVGMVIFDANTSADTQRGFWFNGTGVPRATVVREASLHFQLAGMSMDDSVVETSMSINALFRQSGDKLSQVGVSGNLDLLAQFQHSKFPTLLGGSFMAGKTVFFDRSRQRIGIAQVNGHMCHLASSARDIDVFGANSLPTPGSGCRRGTGSGGGCNRGPWGPQATAALVGDSPIILSA